MHLILLAHFELVVVKNGHHLLIKVLAQVVLKHGLLHGCSALPPVGLLSLQHLVELLLAPIQQEFSEVHLCVFRVIEFLEEAHTQFDV